MSSVKERKRNQPIVQAAQLYQGTKKLLDLQRDATFILIEHKVTGSETFYPLIIEVISYSSSHKYPDQILEAQRLYLSCSKIFEKVNPFQLEKEGDLLTPNCSYAQSLIVKYIFGRITMSEKSLASSSTFLVGINPLDSDPDQDFKLRPYDVAHEGPMILAQLPHIKNISNEVRMAFDFSILDSNQPTLQDCQSLTEKEAKDRQNILTSIAQNANHQSVAELEVEVAADMEVPHVAAVRTATNTFLSFLSRSKNLAEGDQNLPESKRHWHAAVRKIIRQNQVRITKIRLARSMSNTLRREEDHLLKYQYAQKLKEERKESKRKSRMRIDKNDKNDGNGRNEESSAASHQLSFPPFFKQLTDPISNFRPSQLQLQLQLQLPNIGSIMNFKKSKSAKYSYVEGKETDHESNEMTSNSCNSNKASCGSISISRLPNLSNSNYSMSSATDSEHSSTPSSPTLFEREKRQNNRANLASPSSASPSCNPTNTTHILKSNTDVFNISQSNDNDSQNQINSIDHLDIDVYIKNVDYTKELDKSEKVNEFIARQKAFERNERNESIRRSQARRCGVSSRSIENAIDNLHLGIDDTRKGREHIKMNNQINNNNYHNNNKNRNSYMDNYNNFNNNAHDYNGNNNYTVGDNNDDGTLQEALNTENLHNQNVQRCGQIRIKKPFHSFSVSSHQHDSMENKHHHRNHHFQNNNDNDNDNSDQKNQELLKNNSEIKSRQEYPSNSKCRFMDQNNSRSNVNHQNPMMILPAIRIHTAPSLLYNTSHNTSFFTPTLPLPLTNILTQNPSERNEVREPEQPVKIAMISKSRRSFLNNSETNNKDKNNNTNKIGSDNNNNNNNNNNKNNNNNNNTDTYSNTAQSIQQSNMNTDISSNGKTALSSMKSINRDTPTISFPASFDCPDLISHDRRLELSLHHFGTDSITNSFYHASITPLKTNSSCVASPVMSPVASPLSRSKFRST